MFAHKKRSSLLKGFIDPISLAVLAILAISTVVGAVAVTNKGSFDIRKRADNSCSPWAITCPDGASFTESSCSTQTLFNNTWGDGQSRWKIEACAAHQGSGGGGGGTPASPPPADNSNTCSSEAPTASVCLGNAVNSNCNGFPGVCVKNGTAANGRALCGCRANATSAPTNSPAPIISAVPTTTAASTSSPTPAATRTPVSTRSPINTPIPTTTPANTSGVCIFPGQSCSRNSDRSCTINGRTGTQTCNFTKCTGINACNSDPTTCSACNVPPGTPTPVSAARTPVAATIIPHITPPANPTVGPAGNSGGSASTPAPQPTSNGRGLALPATASPRPSTNSSGGSGGGGTGFRGDPTPAPSPAAILNNISSTITSTLQNTSDWLNNTLNSAGDILLNLFR